MEEVFIESRNMGEDSLHTTAVCSSPTCEGENCSASGCHIGDSGNVVFSVSGTVFQFQDLNQAYINSFAAIEFYTGPGGSGQLHKSLQVDAYGNFYSTEPITNLVYPALRYEDTSGIQHVYMPRPVVPTVPSTCNFCHQLTVPPDSDLPTIDDPKHIRINNGIISNGASDTDYHQSFATPPGPNCMQSTCHGVGGAGTTFTMAGLVIQTETDQPYDLGDAAMGLFPEECDDQRYDCQSGVAPEDVIPRTKVAKAFVEINSIGHFYTNQPIDWTVNTYPTLVNYDSDTFCRNIKHMPHDANQQPLADGNCYTCHNGATAISISGLPNPSEQCAL
jgi:hypothetical protein